MKKFTIRPYPVNGESFTGFLSRVAKENDVSIEIIYKIINNGLNPRILLHLLDLNPNKYVHPLIIKHLLDISNAELRKMSFQPMIEKLVDNPYGNYSFASVAKLMEIRQRRFCPKCLQEAGYFKLIWQVKEIEICEIHQNRLVSSCHKCGNVQPYIHSNLGNIECCYCYEKLDKAHQTVIADQQYIEDQMRKIQDWIFLIHPDLFLSKYKDLPPQKSLALLELFLAQGREEEFDPENIKGLAKNQMMWLKRIITGSVRSKYPDPQILLKLVRDYGLSVEEFSNIEVSDKYYQGILGREKPPAEEISCRIPWCSRKSERMFEKIQAGMVCINCGIKYKKNPNGTWQEDQDEINKTLSVKRLLEQGFRGKYITKELGISKDNLKKIEGYLYFHNLFKNPRQQRFFTPDYIENHAYLVHVSGSLYNNPRDIASAKRFLKRRHGLADEDFYYYLALPAVQRIKAKNVIRKIPIFKLKKRLTSILKESTESDMPITRTRIAKELGLSPSTVERIGLSGWIKDYRRKQRERLLLEKAKNYIESTRQNNNRVYSTELYNYLQVKKNRLKRLYPNVEQYINDELIKEGLKHGKLDSATLKNLIEEAIEDLPKTKKIITVEQIAAYLGCTVDLIKKKYKLRPYLIEMGVEI